MRRIEFTIPFLPRMTNPSGRPTHWAVLNTEKNRIHKMVWLLVKESAFLGPPMMKARLTLTRASSSEPDFDGLVSGFKRVIDGLVAAGVLINDKQSVIGQSRYVWEKASPKRGCVKVLVEEC